MLNIEVRGPKLEYALSLQQVERWLDGATTSPAESAESQVEGDLGEGPLLRLPTPWRDAETRISGVVDFG